MMTLEAGLYPMPAHHTKSMAKRRIRWFQFGILDLLILTAVVAIGAALCRPVKAHQGKTAKPWIVGWWMLGTPGTPGTPANLLLLPDGCYTSDEVSRGSGWTLSKHCAVKNAFILVFGAQRLVVQSEWGSDLLEVLDDDGTVKSPMNLVYRLEGPMSRGVPEGTWTFTLNAPPPQSPRFLLEFRRGELADWHQGSDALRNLQALNVMRKSRGLPELTERDFDEGPRRWRLLEGFDSPPR